MLNENIYIRELTEKLSELDPYLVILFGSYAYGTPHKDSDIDLLVVTKDEYLPQTFKEKEDLYIAVGEHIMSISKKVPVDLIVYTMPMYRQFVQSGNSFSKEILSGGIMLYESKRKAMA